MPKRSLVSCMLYKRRGECWGTSIPVIQSLVLQGMLRTVKSSHQDGHGFLQLEEALQRSNFPSPSSPIQGSSASLWLFHHSIGWVQAPHTPLMHLSLQQAFWVVPCARWWPSTMAENAWLMTSGKFITLANLRLPAFSLKQGLMGERSERHLSSCFFFCWKESSPGQTQTHCFCLNREGYF